MEEVRVREHVIRILSEDSKIPITRKTRFRKDLKFDELDMVEFVMNLEETIGMEIPDEDVDKHFENKDVESVIRYIVEQTKHREE
jgi:acyl carrier protein